MQEIIVYISEEAGFNDYNKIILIRVKETCEN